MVVRLEILLNNLVKQIIKRFIGIIGVVVENANSIQDIYVLLAL